MQPNVQYALEAINPKLLKKYALQFNQFASSEYRSQSCPPLHNFSTTVYRV